MDYETAAKYLTNVIAECPASIKHIVLKIECLLKVPNIDEALSYTESLMRNPQYTSNPSIVGWRGRALIYSGNEAQGQKFLKESLRLDPDNQEVKQALKNVKFMSEKKDEASKLFKDGKYKEAIAKFNECVAIDELNVIYNATIYFNIALCKSKYHY